MATSESSTDASKYKLEWYNLSDGKVIAKMNEIIQALENQEIDAVTILPNLVLGLAAGEHIFGKSGNHLCRPKVVSTWLSLLVLLASSENVTGESIVDSFAKRCGGCMVYTILMAVACFSFEERMNYLFDYDDAENITKLAFDFFRHVLADPKGEIFKLDEIIRISSLLNEHIPPRRDRTMMRIVCLEIRTTAHRIHSNTSGKQIVLELRDFVEGLGALCVSKSFATAMKENSTATIQIIKESIANKTLSSDFVRDRWTRWS